MLARRFSNWGGAFMRRRAVAALSFGACMLVAPGAIDHARGAEVVISINKAAQSMAVLVDGIERHKWVVSTGLGGGPHDGSYRAGRMERSWFSRKYQMAPMPHSIFFDGNYAIHGTTHVKRLGRPASKGCVRLHPKNAATLFALVRANHGTTSIVVSRSSHVAARVPPVEATPPTVTNSIPASARDNVGPLRKSIAQGDAPLQEAANGMTAPAEAQPALSPAAPEFEE
jgi:hypothetical protein